MNTDIILFLEENGFAESKDWQNVFLKQAHSEYIKELNISIFVSLTNSIVISVYGKGICGISFILESKINLRLKIQKILNTLDTIIKAEMSGFKVDIFRDHKIVNNNSGKLVIYEDVITSGDAIIHLNKDEPVFELKSSSAVLDYE